MKNQQTICTCIASSTDAFSDEKKIKPAVPVDVLSVAT